VGPAEVMGPCGRGAPPPQSPAPTRPIRPPGTRTHAPYSQLSSLDHGPPSAAAPRPAGDAMTVEHRERARTRRSLHDADARARRGARGARRPAPHAPQSSASPDRLRPRVAWCTALISTAACAQALEGSGDVWPHRVQGKRDGIKRTETVRCVQCGTGCSTDASLAGCASFGSERVALFELVSRPYTMCTTHTHTHTYTHTHATSTSVAHAGAVSSAASYPPYRGTGTSCQAPGCAASGLFGGWVHLIGSHSNYTAQKNRSLKHKKVIILRMCPWARPPL